MVAVEEQIRVQAQELGEAVVEGRQGYGRLVKDDDVGGEGDKFRGVHGRGRVERDELLAGKSDVETAR